MADKKITQLPASTVPLAGTEVLPIVQGGTTKQVSVANLTAGRDVNVNSITTPTVNAAAGSAGITFKNASGTAQMQLGSGGGNNISMEVATNINPVNGAVSIQPSGTGTVTIKPTATGTMDNVQIGVTDPDLAFFNNSVNLNGADTTNAVRGFFVSNDNTDTTNPRLRISARDDVNSIWIDYSTVAGGPAATLAFSNGGNYQWLMTQGGDLAPKAGNTAMKEGFVYIPAGNGAPTDAPTNESAGVTPLYYDETNSNLYAYNTSWKNVGLVTSPSFTGDVTLSTGNLVIGTSGKGVDFSATPGTGTSELLADYEEGTWTPSLGGTWTGYSEGSYVKVGKFVYVYGCIDAVTSLGTGSTTTISGLPYTAAINPPSGNGFAGSVAYFSNLAVNVLHIQTVVIRSSASLTFVSLAAAGGTATASPAIFGNNASIYFSATYIAA